MLPGVGVWELLRPGGEALAWLAAATLAVVLVQHAINVLNDLADWRLGADVEKWDSWVRIHGEDLGLTRLHGGLSFVAGGVLGLATLASSGRWWLLAIALPLVALGFLYNSGSRPLSYTRLAEWVTGLCYGPGVFGCLWLLAGGGASPPGLLGSLAFACLATAILLSHQPPQIATDRAAGKHTFAVRYGAQATWRAARALFLGFLASWAMALAYHRAPGGLPLRFLVVAALVFAGACAAQRSPRYLLLAAGGIFAIQALP